MDLDYQRPSPGPSTQTATVQSTRPPVPPTDLFANSDFPPPPGWYREFTTERWSSHKGKEREDAVMQPPKVNWIEEEKGWSAFGVVHQVKKRMGKWYPKFGYANGCLQCQLPTAFPTLREAGLDTLIPFDTHRKFQPLP